MKTAPDRKRRLNIRVSGLVQGVGFRPYVHRLAGHHGLSGWVYNDGGGVTIEVQGHGVEVFIQALKLEAPPLAHIDRVCHEEIPIQEEAGFSIRASRGGPVTTAILPDAAVCESCLEELFDPASRYYRYPFLNCTHCGPRYTITRSLPYDRASTSMAPFTMCEVCAEEFKQPANRRFHAQPTACQACGPTLSISIEEILEYIQAGHILAIKGLGGYQLVCDATNDRAVQRLRQRKDREEKPLAVMVANRASAEGVAEIDHLSGSLLEQSARPIVLLPKRAYSPLAPSVAPGLGQVGLMLPCTPLHYLLFHEYAGRPVGTQWLHQPLELMLVMTSANPGGEPLVIGVAEAERRLKGIADLIVSHDRAILVRADDSVIGIIDGAPAFIRRARGYVPRAIKLPREFPPILALGAQLKNTLCVVRGDEAFVSQHIGSMDNPETLFFFEQTLEHLLDILQVRPERVAHDAHPDFYSSRFAAGLGLPTVSVQHHHAHLAAVAAEHGLEEPAIGLALDGFGLGYDGGSWGGELMLIDGRHFTRLGHLAPLRQPGGDIAARQPWRMAASVLDRLACGGEIARRFQEQPGAAHMGELLAKDINCLPTSSCGRLFDAACGLLGIQPVVSFEGQAPMQLEALVTRLDIMSGGWEIKGDTLDLLPLLTRLVDCDDAVTGANLFHGTLIAALTDWASQAAGRTGVDTVLLSGGCLLNRVLAEGLIQNLTQCGLRPLIARRLPPNDGGLCLGQAWVAGH